MSVSALSRRLLLGLAGAGLVSGAAHASGFASVPAGDLNDADGDDVVALLKRLIAFNTTNAPGDTRAIAAYLKSLFDAAGVPNEILLAPNGAAAHFIACLPGDGSQRPVLLAAHTDVVPVEPDRWTVDPFAGIEKDGFVYGRGALDNKAAVAAFARAVILLSRAPGVRTRDVIFLAEADEEQGQFNTNWLAENHWSKIDAEFCLNEGGRTVQGADGRVRELQVTYADKLTLNLKISTTGPAGHSSRPLPVDATANGQLISALSRLSAYQADVSLSPQTTAYLTARARLNPGPYADAVRSLLAATNAEARTTAARDLMATENGGWGTEGLLRNTLVITMINSGIKPNVIPGHAEATMNARLLPGVSVETFIADLEAAIGNPRVKIEILSTRAPEELAEFYRRRSAIAPSAIDTPLYAAIEASAAALWPEATVLPTLLVASTDATPWRERGVPVYGIGPAPTDDATIVRVHGDDERVGVPQMREAERFTLDILRRVTAPA